MGKINNMLKSFYNTASLLGRSGLSDSDMLRRKIFVCTITESFLVVLLFAFSLFLFHIMVG